jgi:hypothetical protein
MSDRCPQSFDQSLISGHLDGELPQGADQKTRIHLEDCAHCRTLYEELNELREVTMATEFKHPPDDQWNETPRGLASHANRGLGWLFFIAWLVLLTGYVLWQVWQGDGTSFEKVLVFGGLGGCALLFMSVLLDRLRSAKTDPYREVKK